MFKTSESISVFPNAHTTIFEEWSEFTLWKQATAVQGFCSTFLHARANLHVQAFGKCKDVDYVSLPCPWWACDTCLRPLPSCSEGWEFPATSRIHDALSPDVHCHGQAPLQQSQSWISDCNYQRSQFPAYCQAKRALCSVLTKKKVEIFHSKLCSRITKTDKGPNIQGTARLLPRPYEMFKESYVPVYQRGYSETDLCCDHTSPRAFAQACLLVMSIKRPLES